MSDPNTPSSQNPAQPPLPPIPPVPPPPPTNQTGPTTPIQPVNQNGPVPPVAPQSQPPRQPGNVPPQAPNGQHAQYQQAAPGYPQPPQSKAKAAGGLFAGLFDFKFKNRVGLKVIPVLYAISLVLVSILAIFYLLVGLGSGIAMVAGGAAAGNYLGDSSYSGGGIALGLLTIFGTLIFVPVLWFVYVLISRVTYEFVIAVLQIARNTDRIKE